MARNFLASALVVTVLAGRSLGAFDEGIVTQVTKDTITILNGKEGTTTTYKVAKDLVDNTRPAEKYGQAYPSRFSEVTQGCRIEVQYMKQGDEWVIYGLDVKKDKGK